MSVRTRTKTAEPVADPVAADPVAPVGADPGDTGTGDVLDAELSGGSLAEMETWVWPVAAPGGRMRGVWRALTSARP